MVCLGALDHVIHLTSMLHVGNLMHISVLGEHLIIINSQKVAEELLEKRSRNYSDRPEIPVMHMYDPCSPRDSKSCFDRNGWQVNMGLKHYGNEWRRDRRVLHQRLRREVASSLHPLEVARARTLLHDLLRAPDDFRYHFEL
jgi:cytochrome P450